MTGFTPSRDPGDAERALATLVKPRPDSTLFASRIRRMQRMFSAFKGFSPPPWASPRLEITPEICYQSEQWLPLADISSHYFCLYRQVLTYPPVLSSTPFAQASSWASIVAGFPAFLEQRVNPAELLEQLVMDDDLCMKFLFWSFMPGRFYGSGSDRYPGQTSTINEWTWQRRGQGKRLRCLDAASGDGANSYALARLLVEQGWSPDRFRIEGWTLDPMEAWAAAHGRFPHDSARETSFRTATADCFAQGSAEALLFCPADILNAPDTEPFDLILCNGLLGGPIMHAGYEMAAVMRNLTRLLAPGGMLLAADHFHDGWKQKCPQQGLRALCEQNGLLTIEATEGIAVLKPDQ
jgi:SAM-dependent methyltransferase